MVSKNTKTVRIYAHTLEQIKKEKKEGERLADALDKRLRCKIRVI